MNITDNQTSKSVSIASAITSLIATLFPNTPIDCQQLNHLICNLIPTTSPNTESPSVGPFVDPTEERRERHRKTERIRHNKIVELIRQISESIGLNDRQETQANILNRSARYVLFLSYVIEKLETDEPGSGPAILSDDWLQSLYPLYQRSYEEASKLIENAFDVSGGQELNYSSLTPTPDHCISLRE